MIDTPKRWSHVRPDFHFLVLILLDMQIEAMLSNYGKHVIATEMYTKGKAFIGASILLSRNHGHPSVILHLMCQGIELVLKAILLRCDYDRYQPLLRKLGHNLINIVNAARKASGFHLFMHTAQIELGQVNQYFTHQFLRYAGHFDIFIDPRTIEHRRLFQHTAAIIKYLEKVGYFRENFGSI